MDEDGPRPQAHHEGGLRQGVDGAVGLGVDWAVEKNRFVELAAGVHRGLEDGGCVGEACKVDGAGGVAVGSFVPFCLS